MFQFLRILLSAICLAFCVQAVCHAGNDDISTDFPFNIETTDMAAGTEFVLHISAKGNFVIDWGDDNQQTIARTNTTKTTYSHVYPTGGTYVIKFGGRATGYTTSDIGAIDFDSNTNVRGIYGSIGRIFPTINNGTKGGEQPRFYNLFHLSTNITSSIPADFFAGVHGAPVSMMFRGVFDMSSTEENVMSGEIPGNLFAGITGAPAPHVFRSTFYGCRGLTGTIPENLFAGISGAPAEYMFYNTFYGTVGITGTIPENLFANISGAPVAYMFNNTFGNCTGLTGTIPSGLFAGISGAPADYMFGNLFSGCSGLSGEIPGDLFAGISGQPMQSMFYYTFSGCTGLTGTIPENLFSGISGIPAQSMFFGTFYNCSGLTGEIPENLFAGIYGPATTDMFRATFYGCAKLTGYVPYMLFARIDDIGTATVDGFVNTFGLANLMDRICPAGMSDILKPNTDWRVAFCGGCLLGQYMENEECKSCPAGYIYAGGIGAAITDCKIRCGGGTYLASVGDTTCSDVGAGFFAPEAIIPYGGTSSRYKCPDGLTTAGYGRGADEENDCGKLLHLGLNHTLYTHMDKRTTPSLAVSVGDKTFYADMTPGIYGHQRTIYDNKLYSIYDDRDVYENIALSSGYTRLSYIESNNWAYIDTGIVPTLDLDIYYLAYIPSVTGSGGDKIAVYWVEQGNGLQYYTSAFVTDRTHIRAYRKNTGGPNIYTVISNPNTNMIEWQTRGEVFYINGNQYHFTPPVAGSFGNYNIFVLGKNKKGALDTTDNSFFVNGIRLYRWRIEKEGLVIQDLVPARRDDDNEIGMFDLVTGQFFTNMNPDGYFSGE